ncbi:hypothetical protein ACHHYP_13610 [Achlya hypogyna]|uniref:Uncharacterized protein n=1 Tax=Achlya hypogyna TaxID=1202772 RepID=A0A1V9ZFK0_ACHHY|nr:hypothetical protein ACHHYP_13610 [Achlya hypogyna]
MAVAWVQERALLLILSVLSVLLVTLYTSASVTWLQKDVHFIAARAPPFALSSHWTTARQLGVGNVTSVRWDLSLWDYCLTTHVGANATSVCSMWKEACREADLQHSTVCGAMGSLQTLAFLSLSLSIIGLYIGYRSVTSEKPLVLPLLCLAIRAVQVGLEAGALLEVTSLVPPSALFPYGLDLDKGPFYCFANVCCSAAVFASALFVFLRTSGPHRHEYILFNTVEEIEN